MGAVAALFAAVDAAARAVGASRLWLGRPGPAGLYRWRTIWSVAAGCLAVATVALALPLAVLLLLAVAYLPAFLLEPSRRRSPACSPRVSPMGVSGSPAARPMTALVARVRVACWCSRGRGAAVAFVLDVRRPARARGRPWWQALGAPLTARPASAGRSTGSGASFTGATRLTRPDAADLGRRYAELLGENLTQPGYRELLIAAHDLDTRRDLIFGLVGGGTRLRLFGPTAATTRRAEVVDLSGEGGDHVMDAIAGALSVPILTEPHRHVCTNRSGAARRIACAIVRRRWFGCSRKCRRPGSSR